MAFVPAPRKFPAALGRRRRMCSGLEARHNNYWARRSGRVPAGDRQLSGEGAAATAQTLTPQGKSHSADTTRRHAKTTRGLLACQSGRGFESGRATSAFWLPLRTDRQISPSIVAVASYSVVVTPSDAVTAAPPGQVWPPPLTVTSWAPQEYVVVTICGAIELVMA